MNIACGALLVVCAQVVASAVRADAPTYHLFAPVPREQMRELSTDRPDTTESPYTVDAGHVQVESEAIVHARDRSGDRQQTAFAFGSTNLKLGIWSFADLQLAIEPYHRSTLVISGAESVVEGYGATTGRLKLNLWGNDHQGTALGLMPFVTHEDGLTDLGLSVPFAGTLPWAFGYGLMLQGEWMHPDDSSRGLELLGSATLGHDLLGPLAAYVELAALWATYDGWQSSLATDGGLCVSLSDDLRLDAGTRLGVIGPIDDVQVFLGASARR